MSHPVDGQRNGKRPLTRLTLRAFDSDTYPSPDCTYGPVDLIHVATISRGQNKVPYRFTMNRNPTSYALVYRSKDKKDLAYTCLQDLEGFTERICGGNHDFPDLAFTDVRPYDAAYQVIPKSDFDGDTFAYGRPFPNQDRPAQDEAKLRLIP